MTTTARSISELPQVPALYAMYGGTGRSSYVAYVGIAKRLKRRIRQHLINRESSATTGTSAVSLNTEYITSVKWWISSRFQTEHMRQAAEIIAFRVFDPVLRSRGGISIAARQLAVDQSFSTEIEALLNTAPAGTLLLPTLQAALQRLDTLEHRVARLEQRLDNHE